MPNLLLEMLSQHKRGVGGTRALAHSIKRSEGRMKANCRRPITQDRPTRTNKQQRETTHTTKENKRFSKQKQTYHLTYDGNSNQKKRLFKKAPVFATKVKRNWSIAAEYFQARQSWANRCRSKPGKTKKPKQTTKSHGYSTETQHQLTFMHCKTTSVNKNIFKT